MDELGRALTLARSDHRIFEIALILLLQAYTAADAGLFRYLVGLQSRGETSLDLTRLQVKVLGQLNLRKAILTRLLV